MPPSHLQPSIGLAHLFLLACPFCLSASTSPAIRAQGRDPALSEAEIEKLRDSAFVPADRVMVFIKFLDDRSKSIQDLFAHARRPGREQDAHDLFEQFTAIADELDDNLDDYGPHHRDIRKALPKLIEATDRWATSLKTPPEDATYGLSRKLALDSIRDIHDAAAKLVDDQKAWFLAHPPPKEDKNGTIPR